MSGFDDWGSEGDNGFSLPDLEEDVFPSAPEPYEGDIILPDGYDSPDEEWGVDQRPQSSGDGHTGDRFGVAPDSVASEVRRSRFSEVIEEDLSNALPEFSEEDEEEDDGLSSLFGAPVEDGDPFESIVDEEDDDDLMPVSSTPVFRITDEELDQLQGFDIDSIIHDGILRGASDLEIQPNQPPWFKVNKDMVCATEYGNMSHDVTYYITKLVISNAESSELVEGRRLDFSYTVKTGPSAGRRTRGSAGYSFNENNITMRIISDTIPTPAQIGISDQLLGWVRNASGLFLINGTTGSGKSTTLASMLRYVQQREQKKIITIEKPIEYVYPSDGKSLIVQREVPKDIKSFADGLDSAMREAPDILLIGEARNRDEIDQLLRAAETGHLAISTMHTKSAAETVSRIASNFKEDREQALNILSHVAKGFANQVLAKTIPKPGEKQGRMAFRELLEVDEEVSRMILREDIQGIIDYQVDHKITMEHHLADAVRQGIITKEEALQHVNRVPFFEKLLS